MASCFISARLNLRPLASDRGGAQGEKSKNRLIVGNKLPDIFWATACPRGTNTKHHVPLSGRLLQGSMGSNVPKAALQLKIQFVSRQDAGMKTLFLHRRYPR